MGKRVQETKITSWTNKHSQERKSVVRFGRAKENDAALEKTIVKSVEAVHLEVAKRINQTVGAKDDAEDKFHEESIALVESLFKEKRVWTDMRKEKREEDEPAGGSTGNVVRDAMKRDS